MNEKLPEMYRGNIKNDTDNNERVFSTLNRDRKEEDVKVNREKRIFNEFDIKRKINDIFNSSDYIYKADVTIVTDRGIEKKRIVGKSGGNLLTFDNEKIRISDIRDIYR